MDEELNSTLLLITKDVLDLYKETRNEETGYLNTISKLNCELNEKQKTINALRNQQAISDKEIDRLEQALKVQDDETDNTIINKYNRIKHEFEFYAPCVTDSTSKHLINIIKRIIEE